MYMYYIIWVWHDGRRPQSAHCGMLSHHGLGHIRSTWSRHRPVHPSNNPLLMSGTFTTAVLLVQPWWFGCRQEKENETREHPLNARHKTENAHRHTHTRRARRIPKGQATSRLVIGVFSSWLFEGYFLCLLPPSPPLPSTPGFFDQCSSNTTLFLDHELFKGVRH